MTEQVKSEPEQDVTSDPKQSVTSEPQSSQVEPNMSEQEVKEDPETEQEVEPQKLETESYLPNEGYYCLAINEGILSIDSKNELGGFMPEDIIRSLRNPQKKAICYIVHVNANEKTCKIYFDDEDYMLTVNENNKMTTQEEDDDEPDSQIFQFKQFKGEDFKRFDEVKPVQLVLVKNPSLKILNVDFMVLKYIGKNAPAKLPAILMTEEEVGNNTNQNHRGVNWQDVKEICRVMKEKITPVVRKLKDMTKPVSPQEDTKHPGQKQDN